MESVDKLVKALRASVKEAERLRRQIDELQAAASEPIAVLGMGCRFPGGVEDPASLWRVVEEGRDVVTEFPNDRGWVLDEVYHPDPDHVGTSYVREGGFLDRPDLFDAAFFGISPGEADAMDPQQRLLLEVSWEAIERARIDPTTLRETRTGVYLGLCYHDYQRLVPAPEEAQDGYGALGTAASVASGRIAYILGLQGPALTLDTACSSSLVALHLACQALRKQECSHALVGGATVFSTPESFIVFSRLKALSPRGRCRAFAADADGAGWAEGVGVLLLARLSDALERGYPVLAVIRGSAINQDGRSQGLTAPSGPAQQRVIRDALASAGLSGADVDLLEAHGTGTMLGDPIEALALQATYGRDHGPSNPLWLGSLKSNIGHTQAAAGVGGVIKVVEALRRRRLPQTLHADRPTSHVDWSSASIRLLTNSQEWASPGRLRRAAVSSFGISGTNAHVIVEEAPEQRAAEPHVRASEGPKCLILSGIDEVAVRGQATRLEQFLATERSIDLVDVGYSLLTTRASGNSRGAVIASSVDDARAGLRALADESPASGWFMGSVEGDGKVVFVFPGQGTQWLGMARALLDESEVFRDTIEDCARALAPHVDWSLHSVLRESTDRAMLERVDVVQPVLFAMMVALAATWRAQGVVPDAVIGHSQGEIAAACVAGLLSLEEAARVIAVRSKILTMLAGGGAMAAVMLSSDEALDHITRLQGSSEPSRSLAIAVDNGASTVIAGDSDAVDALVASLVGEGIFARRVAVDYASHCAAVSAVEAPLANALGRVETKTGTIPMLSTVDVLWCEGRALDARYWYQNLRRRVRFAEGVRALLDRGYRAFIEVSPHPVLSHALSHLFAQSSVQAIAVPSLRRDTGRLHDLFVSIGEYACRGGRVDWTKHYASANPRVIDLPTYAFQRRSHWMGGKAEERSETSRDLSDVPRLLRRELARILRLPEAALVGGASFSSLGLDSLRAVELRGRLQAITGLSLPSTVALEHPTLDQLSGHLESKFASTEKSRTSGSETRESQPNSMSRMLDSFGARPRKHARGSSGEGSMVRLVGEAIAADQSEAAWAMIESIARVHASCRPTRRANLEPVRLAESSSNVSLFCVASPAVPSSPLQYARLARAVGDRASVWATTGPGYALGEEFAASAAEITASLLEQVKATNVVRPVLLGFSGGGWLAADLAAAMEASMPAAGLVLLDTPLPQGSQSAIAAARDQVVAREIEAFARGRSLYSEFELLHQCAAMLATWRHYVPGWAMPHLEVTPTLFVRASAGMPTAAGVVVNEPAEYLGHLPRWTVDTINCDHFELISDCVDNVGATSIDWVRALGYGFVR